MSRRWLHLLCAALVTPLRVGASTLAFLPNEALDFDNPPAEDDWIELCRDPQLLTPTSDVSPPDAPFTQIRSPEGSQWMWCSSLSQPIVCLTREAVWCSGREFVLTQPGPTALLLDAMRIWLHCT
jgi:hypothetical protein